MNPDSQDEVLGHPLNIRDADRATRQRIASVAAEAAALAQARAALEAAAASAYRSGPTERWEAIVELSRQTNRWFAQAHEEVLSLTE